MRRCAPLLAAVVPLALAGCGQKGPLYLPDKNAAVVTGPAASAAPAWPATSPATSSAPKKPDKDADSQPPPAPPQQ